ncbi:MAG TPA: 23S rRNA (adenine(2030)-N(6))-methyltransferase RlmJ [Nevskiaceae bacterium]|nr:23S rRNA (adenine(2030)-N(6))-methyltransferase RlmJ [Nevskiaceae bacterium]
MHYQHRYHAGNFADVFKHALLCELLAALNRKEAPWFYLETHAGAGIYDLSRDEAARTAEFEGGIARLWDLRDQDSPIGNYLRLIGALNPDGELRHYPGSPLVAQKLARDSDRLALCEKVPEVAASLKQSLGRDARVAVHARDGYEAYALLPLPQKRGLVLIDPPFERRDEFDAVGDFLARAVGRFNNGIYVAWYPVKNRHASAKFIRRCERELERPLLRVELDTDAHAEGQMRACGMLVVNPPFGFDERARGIMKLLARKLAQGPRPQWSVA